MPRTLINRVKQLEAENARLKQRVKDLEAGYWDDDDDDDDGDEDDDDDGDEDDASGPPDPAPRSERR